MKNVGYAASIVRLTAVSVRRVLIGARTVCAAPGVDAGIVRLRISGAMLAAVALPSGTSYSQPLTQCAHTAWRMQEL